MNNRRSLHQMVRRLGIAWKVRLPKRACRRLRIYGAICRMNGRLRAGLSDTQLRWWHRNSGRLLKLDAKWFHRAETSKPPMVRHRSNSQTKNKMKTYYLELTKRQQQEIEENRKKGRCTVMQPLVRDGKSSLLRCCVISNREMKAVNAGIEASRKMPNSEVSQNAADKPKLKLLQTTRINLK